MTKGEKKKLIELWVALSEAITESQQAEWNDGVVQGIYALDNTHSVEKKEASEAKRTAAADAVRERMHELMTMAAS
jgi:hypothetical protein